MNNYYMNLTREEKENILDKHKTLYDGYAVRQPQSNMTPLYTQDYANDKGGITINSKGEISSYNNKIYMKESKEICSECGLYEEMCECGSGVMNEGMCNECGGQMNECECSECGYKVAKNMDSNEFDYTEEIEEDDCMECGGGGMYEADIDDIMSEIEDDVEFEDEVEDIKESIQESLNWFKKFKNYN
jgi:hypothetical protein